MFYRNLLHHKVQRGLAHRIGEIGKRHTLPDGSDLARDGQIHPVGRFEQRVQGLEEYEIGSDVDRQVVGDVRGVGGGDGTGMLSDACAVSFWLVGGMIAFTSAAGSRATKLPVVVAYSIDSLSRQGWRISRNVKIVNGKDTYRHSQLTRPIAPPVSLSPP